MINSFMNTREAAAFLELTERRITGLCKAGEIIGAIKEGIMWFIPEEGLKLYKITHKRNKKSMRNSNKLGEVLC